ncbi:MAG: hypothetical protein PVG66_03620 [Chromatiales bacterium]|jgi:hypothetical protein
MVHDMIASFTGGLLIVLAGCIAIYLDSPHQRWLAHSRTSRINVWGGVLLLIAGLVVLMSSMQGAAAVFVWLVWIMLLFVSFPYLGVLFSMRKKSS